MSDKDFHSRFEKSNSSESLSNKGLYLLIKWGLVLLLIVGGFAAAIGMVVTVAVTAYKFAPVILIAGLIIVGLWWLSNKYPDEPSN